MNAVGRFYRASALVWLNFCILFVVANLVAAAFLQARGGREGDFVGWVEDPPPFIREAMARSFPDWSDADRLALWREHAHVMVGDPLVQYRERPLDGRFVRVDPNGFRAGRDQGPWPPSPEHYNVFFFGGSTGFGYGVPDDETVPSHLQQQLPGVDGRSPRVYNFGRGGYDSTQERVLFEKLVFLGHVPDLAVFLDGVNDFANPLHPSLIARGLTEKSERDQASPVLAALRLLPLARLVQKSPLNLALERQAAAQQEEAAQRDAGEAAPRTGRRRKPVVDDAVLDHTIQRYVANREIVRAIAAAHDVRVAFVWQPAPTYGYDLSQHTFRGKHFGPHEASRGGYPRMRAHVDAHPMGDDFLWCADLQQGVQELLYVDKMHYAPGMSERVARCIADGLAARGALH